LFWHRGVDHRGKVLRFNERANFDLGVFDHRVRAFLHPSRAYANGGGSAFRQRPAGVCVVASFLLPHLVSNPTMTMKTIVLAPMALLILAAPAWAVSPVVRLIQPAGGQRGTEVTATLTGQRLKSLFCQVLVMQNGEPILHNLGSGRLRVDQPIAKKSLAGPGLAGGVKPGRANTDVARNDSRKPLSRLEKLRRDQRERTGGGK
jgi:hypothetical protein